MESRDLVVVCPYCGRRSALHEGTVRLVPRNPIRGRELDLGEKYRGRARSLSGWRRRLYQRLRPDAVRFIGDEQRAAGKNAHQKVLAFVDSSHATVLDIGSGNRRLRDNVVTTDIAVGTNIDIQLDAHVLPFEDASIDRIVIQHVLEHVSSPSRVIAEVVRVLRPGGQAYVEVPFLFPIHERNDFRRWTIAGLATDLGPLRVVEAGTTMGVGSTVATIIRAALTHRIRNPYVSTAVDVLTGWLLTPVRLFDRAAAPEAQIVAGAIFAVAEKPSE